MAATQFMLATVHAFHAARPQAFAKKHEGFWALFGILYGIYDGTTAFGPYDGLANDLSLVAVYKMRAVDSPDVQAPAPPVGAVVVVVMIVLAVVGVVAWRASLSYAHYAPRVREWALCLRSRSPFKLFDIAGTPK